MTQQSVPSLDTTPTRTERYAFPLRRLPNGRPQNVHVEVPTDFTPAEAVRVAGFLDELARGLAAMREKP